MIGKIFPILAAAALLGAILQPAASATEPRPFNVASHTAEFFEDLLTRRVWVYRANGRPAAHYFGSNGNTVACWFHRTRDTYVHTFRGATWAINRNTSQYRLRFTNADTTWTRVPIYTPDTGRFHVEARNKNTGHWQIDADGWIQDDWPQILLDRCPHLGLPIGTFINEKQDSLDFAEVKANATPVRNHPGSDLQFPGATGVGASNGQPTMTLEEVEATFKRYDRHIARKSTTGRVVFAPRPGYHELWEIDDNNNVTDVAIMRLVSNGTVLHTKWEKSGRSGRLRVGYPIPALPTDQLHPVFAMMDELTASRKPVTLPSITTRPDAHVFASDGTVRTPHSAGTWHISRGAVHVDIDSVKRAWPWKDFAERAGWSG